MAQNGVDGGSEAPNYADYDVIVSVAKKVRELANLGDDELPTVGIVCGSGLGGLAASVESPKSIPYKAIPGFPETHVKGHKGELVFGTLEGKRVVCMAGRFHPYEGHDLKQCVLPIRVMKVLGANTILLTNAAGGINQSFKAGDLMVIKDHLAWPILALRGPLLGPNDERLGPRFLSLNGAYDPQLRAALHTAAGGIGESLREGVYAMAGGPQFESPAELRALQTLGCDAVGMSVAHEAIAARHCGLRVAAFSLITNMSDLHPDAGFKPDLHDEVLEAGRLGAARASAVVKAFIKAL